MFSHKSIIPHTPHHVVVGERRKERRWGNVEQAFSASGPFFLSLARSLVDARPPSLPPSLPQPQSEINWQTAQNAKREDAGAQNSPLSGGLRSRDN